MACVTFFLFVMPAAVIAVLITPGGPPQTVLPPNSTLEAQAVELPFDYTSKDGIYTTAKTVPGCSPEQVSLSYYGVDDRGLASVLVSWATCEAILYAPPALGNCSVPSVRSGRVRKALSTTGLISKVRWAPTARGKGFTAACTATATPTSYWYDFSSVGGMNYASPVLHHVLIKGLEQGCQYQYTIVDNVDFATQTGSRMRALRPYHYGPRPFTATFTVPGASPASTLSAASPFPVTIGVIGDPGQVYNTTDTLRQLTQSNPELVWLVGDYAYADADYLPGVAPAACNTSTTDSYQPRWDTWGRLLQPLLSRVPVMMSNGDHEINPQPAYGWQPYNTNFTRKMVVFNARWPGPQAGATVDPVPITTGPLLPQPGAPMSLNSSGIPAPGAYTNLYYKAEIPGVATTIWLSSYSPYDTYAFTQDSEQIKWLKKTLSAVDRRSTPWLVVIWHAPWYNTYVAHFQENECFRQAIEPLLMQYSVDITLHGHVHAYERTKPVYDFKVDRTGCAPIHINVGDAGNIENVYSMFTSNTTCPLTPVFPAYQPQQCTRTFSGPGSGCPTNNQPCNCFTKQPAWSAYREPSFGHGVLKFESATTATWTWYKNRNRRKTPSDSITVTRLPSCSQT